MSADQGRQTGFFRLQLSDWRQFRAIDIVFHDRLTVLTGQNGTGKTTLLQVLGRHFNAWTQMLGVPHSDRGGGGLRWWMDSRSDVVSRQVGTLTYRSPGQTSLPRATIEASAGQAYEVTYAGNQFVPGLYLGSHRQPASYTPLNQIPTSFSPANVILDQTVNEYRNRYAGSWGGRSPGHILKEALFAAGVYGFGNAAMDPNPEAMDIWQGFQQVLKTVLPESLGFIELRLRMPEVIFHTSTGDFLLEAMSGGISAIVEMSWQVFLRSRSYDQFTVCIDEPENHLHPSLQRSLVPSLLAAFPRISFVVASHSPFIVTSVDDSNVYALDYVDDEVESRLLDYASKAASSDETLRRVLGLESTMPLWVERRVAEAIGDFPTSNPSEEDFARLYSALTAAGLRDEFPTALDSLIAQGSDGDAEAK